MGVKLQFFPLDVTYKVIDNKAVILLFGRTADGQQVCVLDESFEPYFYVIPKKGNDVAEKLEKISVEIDDKVSSVAKARQLIKKLNGNQVTAIKVFTKLPRDVPIIRDVIKEWEIIQSINEYDILFARRYLIDKDITPMTLCEAEGDFVSFKSKVPVLKATKLEQFSADALINPKILAFDIETYNPSGKEMAPDKNPIIMVSFYGENFKKVITWKRFKTTEEYIEFVESEAQLIERIKEIIEVFKPDIITGYFSDGFDFPYIETRAKKYKIRLDLGLDYSDLAIETKPQSAAKLTGIVHLDIFKFIRKIMGSSMDTETYGLSNVAHELIGEQKQDVELDNMADVWDNKIEEIEKFCRYNLHDSYLAYKLSEKVFPNIVELVKIVGLPVYDIIRMGFSQLVEWYLIKQALNFNEICPNRPNYNEIKQRRMQTYTGAFVYEPQPGLYSDIVVFDYRSLYPTVLSSHNISPDTLNCACCEGQNRTPGEKYWFCAKKKGFLPAVIEDLITRRMRIKEIIKEDEEKFRLLDARQNSLKLLANSFYGYLGFFGARWYSIECARSVTAYGRFYIHKVIDRAKSSGFKVLYSDTDSIFLALQNRTKEDAKKFLESINLELPGLMELEYEDFYPNGIFVSAKEGAYGAKKKYALISENGVLKIRGFEAIRRNWSFIAKEVQKNVLNLVLKENDKAKAFKYVREVIEELKGNKTPADKVVIYTQLQKEISDYDSISPHVRVAKRMQDKGLSVGPGSLIKFIVTKGEGTIGDKARLPEEVKQEDYDPDYYIHNQIIPAVEKIFNVLGYTKEDLLASKEQSKLGSYF